MARLLLLEFNEISFESVSHYCSRGLLPHFRQMIEKSGWSTTTSEREYEHLEPWIQWVTAHTGLTFAEHGVFRLGDIVNCDLPQIWEQLEAKGLKVGAICPMNAKHRLRNPAFFVPDPWTPTDITAPPILRRLAAAVSQAVNDNSQNKVTLKSALALVAGIVAYANPMNYGRYAKLVAGAGRHSWNRALFLDLLLADIFVRQVRRTGPHFSSLFLNAGAHIQHHYMFSSASYAGPLRNPSWYAPPGVDPVLEVYELYDHILGMMQRAFPSARFMVATGLHQEPYPKETYYWRLKDHAAFLRRIAVPFVKVDARMSRDFLLTCGDEHQAVIAADRLARAVTRDGTPLFEVDNRGRDIFAMLVYPRDIGKDLLFQIGAEEYSDLSANVAFVALKNGWHSGIGYFFDTGVPKGELPAEFPLTEVPQRIANALNVGSLHAA
ncbi:MAG: hypothetical protein ABL964_01545 [Steroidobacteraceae bacterium]